MNALMMSSGGGDGSGELTERSFSVSPEQKQDQTLAACSRFLLGNEPAENALQKALACLSSGLDALHVTLYKIESYHADDKRVRWLSCSSEAPCPFYQEDREWDYIRLIDDDIRTRMKIGQRCNVHISQLPDDLQDEFRTRGAEELVLLPLTVLGEWWGFLCIEAAEQAYIHFSDEDLHLSTAAALFAVYFERRYAADRYKELNKLSGALETAGTVCHKLNQPMQVILGYASMVTSGDIRETEQIIEIVQLIEDETRQMGIITKNLMGITKNRGSL